MSHKPFMTSRVQYSWVTAHKNLNMKGYKIHHMVVSSDARRTHQSSLLGNLSTLPFKATEPSQDPTWTTCRQYALVRYVLSIELSYQK